MILLGQGTTRAKSFARLAQARAGCAAEVMWDVCDRFLDSSAAHQINIGLLRSTYDVDD